jgi:hypothetical protein
LGFNKDHHKQKEKCQAKNIKLSINGKLTEDKTLIANSFNNFFTNIGENLDKNIPPTQTDPISFIKKKYTINIFLRPTSSFEIGKIINKLKKCAVGWDNFPSDIIKDNTLIMSDLLTHLINLSIEEGIFPSELKIGNIILLFKAGCEETIGNYRPVSLLSTFSKIVGTFFYIRLLDFLKSQNILYISQFGFRENHSTCMAILTLLDQIIKAIDYDKFAIGIFIDFAKAFDNQQILLKKLYHYGIRGSAHKWITSNLSNRKQYCTFQSVKSDVTTLTVGYHEGRY